MATTTAEIFQCTSTAGSFLLPRMDSLEQASCSRVVRFDNECVLIPKTSPTRSKMPVVLTKSYSLPLWKRKPNQPNQSNHFSDSDAEDAPPSPEDNRITIKVPIPTFRRRTSRSPTFRTRSVSTSPTITRSLPPCLVYRSPSTLVSSSVKPLLPVRRPSLPIYHRRQDELTVPLRDCCADCERITEECLKEGDDWKEKFSRGARRRQRSASLEHSDDPPMTIPTSPQTRYANSTTAFTPFSTEGSTSRDATSRFSATTAAGFSITVDEVDKRRKSFEYNMEDTDFICTLSPPLGVTPPPSSSPLFHSSAFPFTSSSASSRYTRVKPRDREVSSSSTASSISTTDEFLPVLDNRLRSSPIEEEDETQLFPLPRRSRSNTPSPSPSPKASPHPSPNGSTSSLPDRITPYLSSKWNSSSSQESVLSNSLSRKAQNGHLAAPTASIITRSSTINGDSTISSPSPSPSSSPQPKHPLPRLNIPKAPTVGERAAGTPLSPKGPRPLATSKVLSTSSPSDPDNKPSSAKHVPSTISSNITSSNEISNQNTTPPPVPPTPISPSTNNNIPNVTPLPEPANNNNNNNKSSSSNHTLSPSAQRPPQQKRKVSFTLPFIKAGGAIRDAGADVLKGVSSISSGGVVGNTGF
ncbi:hypothetical protein BYT27DRAFT_7247811 [Phlegmacium glaucopus]|nr:hypothetical protein BYT27DRAFT_7247811 [Phlegmacium glaucopus]